MSSHGEVRATPLAGWPGEWRRRRGVVGLLLLLALVACDRLAVAPTPSPSRLESPPTVMVPTSSKPPGAVVPADQVAAHLATLWRQVDAGAVGTPGTGPGLRWEMVLSPALPTEWPPTATTVWVRYAYAHGHDLTLRDGVRVARPWARVNLPAGGGPATVVMLGRRLEFDPRRDIQGVRPLDTATAGALRSADQVLALCLRLTALPGDSSPEAASLRAYYRAWLATNGTIAAQITPAHDAFIAWVRA